MNWKCSLGFHDFGRVDHSRIVKDKIIAHLRSIGLTKYETGTGISSHESWRADNGVRLSRNSKWDDEYDIMHLVPFDCHVKICIKCRKVKFNYDMEEIRQGIDQLYAKYLRKLEREKAVEKLAEELL